MSLVPVPSLTPHAPLGAAVTFSFGLSGRPAELAFTDTGTEEDHDLFVGCRHSPQAPWSLLPFFADAPNRPTALPKGRFGRFLGWASDKWMIGPLVFKLCTPFDPNPATTDDAFRYAPVLCGYLEYDNTHGDDSVDVIFGIGGSAAPIQSNVIVGFAFDETFGFATAPTSELDVRSGGAIFGSETGPATACVFTIPPREKRIYPLVLGFFRRDFHHALLFTDLPAVLAHGLAQHARYLAVSDARDTELMRTAQNLEARAQTAESVRAWLAQSRRRLSEPELDLSDLRSLCSAVTG
jgi:hypothetical protein